MVRNWCKMDQNGDTLNKHGEKQIVKKGGHMVEKKLCDEALGSGPANKEKKPEQSIHPRILLCHNAP